METQQTQQQTTKACPDCGAILTAKTEYRTWCQQCNWNLQLPGEMIQPKTPLEAFVLGMSQRHSEALFKEATTTNPRALKTRVSSAKLASFTIATLVYGVSLLVGGLGLFLIFNYYWNPIVFLFALGMIGFSLFARPHLGKMPEFPSEPEQFPTLVKLINTISDSLGTSRISSIVLDESFSASFTEIGWRKKKVLHLGVPLLSILNAQEIVALIGHELAHGVNGDPTRGRYVGSAIQTLLRWRVTLHPIELWEEGSGIAGLLGVPFRLLFWGLSELVNLIAILLMNLLWHDSQRSEYLADFLAASVSGTKGMLGALEKLHYSSAFTTTVHQVSLKKSNRGFFKEFSERLAHFPSHEVERIRRLERLPSSRLDTTHPPTVYRIDFLKTHVSEEPKVILEKDDYEKIQQELAAQHDDIQQRLVASYRAQLYG